MFPGPAFVEMPPPYAEVENDPPPPYTPLGMLQPSGPREGDTRGSVRSSALTPIPQGRQAIHRNPQFSNQLTTGNTPMVTPTGGMFRSSQPGTRQVSANSRARSVNMVQFDNQTQASPNTVALAVNIHVNNSVTQNSENQDSTREHG